MNMDAIGVACVGPKTDEAIVKWLFQRRPRKHGRPHLEHIDAVFLREMGLNPDDFRDDIDRHRNSLLFTPFRDYRR
jgi:hypothetical protein